MSNTIKTLRLFVCKSCQGIYQEMISHCDCSDTPTEIEEEIYLRITDDMLDKLKDLEE